MTTSISISRSDVQLRFALSGIPAVVALLCVCRVGTVFAAAGALDSSFDGDGIRIIPLVEDNRGQAVAIQPADGKIVIAGYSKIFGSNDVLVVRLNNDGSFDSTFHNGQAQVVSRTGDDRGLAVALQNDRKIVVAGHTDVFGTEDILVMRFNEDGSLDTSFNASTVGGRASGGVQVLRRSGDDRAKAVAIRTDGKIVVVGTSNVFGTNDVLVLRLNADGSLDTRFNNGGSQVVARPSDDRACAVVLQDRKIVVAGYSNTLGANDVQVLRFNENGGLDTTFNTTNVGRRKSGGSQVISQTGDDQVQAIALQGNKIIVVGQTDRFGSTDIQVMRLNANGGLDSTFNPVNAPTGRTGGDRRHATKWRGPGTSCRSAKRGWQDCDCWLHGSIGLERFSCPAFELQWNTRHELRWGRNTDCRSLWR